MVGNVPFWYREGKFCQDSDLPDYLNDLNAMHEAEKVFELAELNKYPSKIGVGNYADKLANVVGGVPGCYAQLHATAAQRSEAFLKTLGLWKE